MNEQLGSAPIDDGFRASMNRLASMLDLFFNQGLVGEQRTTGFVLLVFPFGDQERRCNYISNGADRAEIVKLFREQANRFDTEMM